MDSGDFFGQAGDQDSLKSEYMVQAMDRLGYDAVTLGEREFNFGQAFLLSTFKKTKIDVVSANLFYADTKKPFVKPYVIKRMCNARVAFFGLIGTDVKIRTLPTERGLEVKDPIATAKALVPELRKKADVVVLLSHIGLTEGQRLTLEVPGIDVMIFGHQPGLFREIAKTNGVINTRSGERGQYIPGIHLIVEDGKLTSYDGEVVTLDDKVPADDEMNRSVDAFNDEMNRRFAAAPTNANANTSTPPAVPLAADHFLGEKNCRRCHEAEYQMYSSQQHATAFATLTKNQRDSSPECLPCHVVGYGQPGGFANKTATPDLVNVQCENCHGMGTKHPDKDASVVVGPDVCLTCHTHEQNPDFDYDKALTHIVHWKQ